MGKLKKGHTFGFSATKQRSRQNIKRCVYSDGITKNLRSRAIVVSSGMQNPSTAETSRPSTRPQTRQASDKTNAASVNRNKLRKPKFCERTSAIWKQEAQSNRLIHIEQNAIMWNTAFDEHRIFAPNCRGFLHWDMSAEQIRGLGCKEKMICTNCDYKSKIFKLYSEVRTGKRGPATAKQNIGLAVGMSKTPVGTASLQKLCLSADITAPSCSGLQKTVNKVLPKIVKINKEALKLNNLKLIEKQKSAGSRTPNILDIQSDGLYNNNFYSGVGKTPFQPATQVIYTLTENVTPNHDIMGLVVHNKLCNKRKHLKLDHHEPCSAECFATIPFQKNIGDERTWAKEALLELKKESDIEVGHIITDPDSAAYLAAQDLCTDKITKNKPIHQLDTSHVSRNHRKFIKGHTKLSGLITGRTAAIRKKNKNKLAIDIAKRCQGEMKKACETHSGDIDKIKKKLSFAVDAIVKCYQNDHSLCKKQSFVCKGCEKKNWITNSPFLGKNFTLKTVQDASDILRTCINHRLGPEKLEKTIFLFNTQKAEAFNRALRTALPKNVTFTRNVAGRAHSVCHSINQGTGTSIMSLCNQLGCTICPNSKVDRALTRLQHYEKVRRSRQKTKKAIKARAKKIKKFYSLYEEYQEEIGYQNDKLVKPILPRHMQLHNYSEESKCKRVKVRR